MSYLVVLHGRHSGFLFVAKLSNGRSSRGITAFSVRLQMVNNPSKKTTGIVLICMCVSYCCLQPRDKMYRTLDELKRLHCLYLTLQS